MKEMFLGFDVLPAEKTGIDGPCAWPDHGRRSAESRQHDRNPGITDVARSNPQLDDGDQRSRYRCPQADEQKYPGAGCNHLRNHRRGKRFVPQFNDPEVDQQDGGQRALKQKTHTRPAVGKCRK